MQGIGGTFCLKAANNEVATEGFVEMETEDDELATRLSESGNDDSEGSHLSAHHRDAIVGLDHPMTNTQDSMGVLLGVDELDVDHNWILSNNIKKHDDEIDTKGEMKWIMDSGASFSICPYRSAFISYEPFSQNGNHRVVEFSNGEKASILGKGSLTLIKNCYYVPDITVGTVSMGQLLRNKYQVITDSNGITVTKDGNVEMVFELNMNDNLFYLSYEYVQMLAMPVIKSNKLGLITRDRDNLLYKLHIEMGHLSESGIMKLFRTNSVISNKYSYDDIKNLTLPHCVACMQGRMKKHPSNKPTEQKWGILEKIAVDFKGPFKNKAHQGYIGFYYFSDKSSDFCRAYLVKSKTELLNVMKKFKLEIFDFINATRRESNSDLPQVMWKVFQTDSDSVATSEEVTNWCLENGITLSVSVPYAHSDNGQIERDIQNLMNRSRTLIHSLQVPGWAWGYAVLHAVWLINRSPSGSKNGHKTPLEIVFGKKPCFDHVPEFFRPGVAHVTNEEHGSQIAWKPKALPVRFLGMDDFSNGYTLWNMEENSVFVRKDVRWDDSLITVDFDEAIVTYPEIEPEVIDEFDTMIPDEDDELVMGVVNFIQDLEINEADEKAEKLLEEKGLKIKEFTCPKAPPNLQAAYAGPDGDLWRAAKKSEDDNMDKYGVFGPAPQTGPGMKSKVVLQTSLNNDYSIKRKVRLVACGYSQREGIDFNEKYSPTGQAGVVILMTIIGVNKMSYKTNFDVSAAFLEADTDIQQFMWLPPEWSDDGKSVRVELLKNLYGMKQAPLVWYEHIAKILKKLGFENCPFDVCLWRTRHGDDYFIISLHVDDGFTLSSRKAVTLFFMEVIRKKLKNVKLYDPFQRFLAIDFIEKDDGIWLSHEKYIEENEKLKLLDSEATKQADIPMNPNVNLRQCQPNEELDNLLEITGTIRFPADRGRWDLLCPLGELSSGGIPHPSNEHVVVARQMIQYMHATKNRCLQINGREKKMRLFGFSDAAYIKDGDAKSRLGGCLFYGLHSGAFHSYSTKATVVSHSAMDAEILAIDKLIKDIVFYKGILTFLGEVVDETTTIFIDAKNALDLLSTLRSNQNTRHLNVRVQYIRQEISDKRITLRFIPSECNIADVLTKPLNSTYFWKHTERLMCGFNGSLDYLFEYAGTREKIIGRKEHDK